MHFTILLQARIIRFLGDVLTRRYECSIGFMCFLNSLKSFALTASRNATKLSFFNMVRIA